MAFGLLYMLMALIGKAGSDVKYSIDRISTREQAKERGSDTYIDGRGITRTVNGNQAVSFYRNDRGETRLLDKHGDTVKIYNENKEESYSIVTVKNCVDKWGNQEYCDKIPKHKNCSFYGIKLQDIQTGKYLSLREIWIEKRWEKIGKNYKEVGIKHLFYIDPLTLNIIRESDGEAEFRRKGNKNIPDIETINNFIIKYNKEQKEKYEPEDSVTCPSECYSTRDISIKNIEKWVREQKER